MLKGKDSEDCDGKESTGDEKEKNASGNFAAEECPINFHDLKSDQNLEASPT